MKTIKKTLLILITIFSISTINAQEEAVKESKVDFDLGVDIASRYIWRGLQLSDGVAIQPFIEMSVGNFTLGTWGSYQPGDTGYAQELDFYASYAIKSFTIGFTDYAFPQDNFAGQYFNASGHVGEVSLSFDGPEKFPLSVALYMNVYNDDDNSFYSQIEYPFSVKKVDLSLFVGAGTGFYTMDTNYMINNFGIKASKDIQVTESFSFGLSASAIFNPDNEDAYLVAIISL
jgi:uncharacterized protein (TIGR02001 family)